VCKSKKEHKIRLQVCRDCENGLVFEVFMLKNIQIITHLGNCEFWMLP